MHKSRINYEPNRAFWENDEEFWTNEVLPIGPFFTNYLYCLIMCAFMFVVSPVTFTLVGLLVALPIMIITIMFCRKENRDGWEHAHEPMIWVISVFFISIWVTLGLMLSDHLFAAQMVFASCSLFGGILCAITAILNYCIDLNERTPGVLIYTIMKVSLTLSSGIGFFVSPFLATAFGIEAGAGVIIGLSAAFTGGVTLFAVIVAAIIVHFAWRSPAQQAVSQSSAQHTAPRYPSTSLPPPNKLCKFKFNVFQYTCCDNV